jgi:DNA-binding beta-propeller fold protein YncE
VDKTKCLDVSIRMRWLPAVLLALIAPFTALGQTYTISTFAGGGLPVNIQGTSASLYGTTAVAVDKTGNVFFASLNAILRWDATTGIVTLVAGDGTRGFSGDSGPATDAVLNEPLGVAVDKSGNIYIADAGNNRVRMVSNGAITTIIGNGNPGELNYPTGVAVDSSTGNVYVADNGNGRVIELSNGVTTIIAGPVSPSGVAVDASGNVYFTNMTGPASGSVIEIANGVTTTVVTGLVRPDGVAVDAHGNLYIADPGSETIMTGTGTTIAGNGTPGYGGDSGPAMGAELNGPQGVAVDTNGNVYIADTFNYRIRRVTSGVISTVAGNGTHGFSGDNGPATSAELFGPLNVAVDSVGGVYIADVGNNRIRAVSNGMINTVAGNGTAGSGGDGLPATDAELDNAQGVAVDTTGNLYIADTSNNRIQEVVNGIMTTLAQNSDDSYVSDPSGLALGSMGTLYVAQPGGGYSTGDVIQLAGPTTTIVLHTGLNQPYGVAADSGGDVYIADTYNNRILKLTNGGTTTVAGNGTQGFSGDNGPATSAQLFNPQGIAVDYAGNLYIADTYNNRIRKVSNGVIATVAGGGTSGPGDNGPSTSSQLASPTGVAVDSNGIVYIADFGDNRVRVLTPVAQTITFLPLNNVTLEAAPFAISATATSGLAVGFVSNTTGVCTVSGNEVTIVASGTCSITASQPGDSTWPAAPPVTQTFTVSAGPAVYSFSPNSGTGASVTFQTVFYDSNGAGDLNELLLQVNTSQTSANGCYVYYQPQGNHLYLSNNAGTAWMTPALTPGVAGTASNSQCTLNAASSSVGSAGDNLTVSVALTFSATFLGLKNVYLYAAGLSGKNSGWVKEGTWTNPAAGPPSIVSLAPNSGSETSVTFQAVYSDPNGAADLSAVLLQVNATQSSSHACYVYYQPQGNLLYLANDAGSAWMTPGLTPGVSGSASNSRCTLNAAASSVATAANNLTLNVALGFSGTFIGSQNVYLYAAAYSGLNSGWVKEGTWTPNPIAGPPAIVSLSPASGAGTSVTFQAVYSDPEGAADLNEILLQVNTIQSSANACYVYYHPQANLLYLYNNGAWILPGLTPGMAGTVSNNQCTLNAGSSSVTTTGNNLTLNAALTFSGMFGSAKNVYLYAAGLSGLNSGWVKEGSWTP